MAPAECPFERSKNYRVKVHISELGHEFAPGEIVTFSTCSYDPHNGASRYWFRKQGTDEVAAWHVWDSQPEATQSWTAFFEKLE